MTFTVSTKAASPTSLEEPFWCSFFISGTMENSLPQKSRFNILPSINPILLTQYNNQIEHTGDSESVSQILWHFQNAVVRLESLQIYIVVQVHCVWNDDFSMCLLTAYCENAKSCQRTLQYITFLSYWVSQCSWYLFQNASSFWKGETIEKL